MVVTRPGQIHQPTAVLDNLCWPSSSHHNWLPLRWPPLGQGEHSWEGGWCRDFSDREYSGLLDGCLWREPRPPEVTQYWTRREKDKIEVTSLASGAPQFSLLQHLTVLSAFLASSNLSQRDSSRPEWSLWSYKSISCYGRWYWLLNFQKIES